MLNSNLPGPRAEVARVLADYYSELAGSVAKPAPRFSFARMFREMTTKEGLQDGYEREVVATAAMLAGAPHIGHRSFAPWNAFAERTTHVVGTDSVGGYLRDVRNLPTLDVLRPWSTVVRAGITTVENLRSNTTIPVETGAVTGQSLASESTAIVESVSAIGQAALTPRTFGALLSFSRLLMLQAPNLEEFFRNQLLRAAAWAIDQAVLVGSGTEQPVGILNTPSLPSESGTSFALANATNMLKTLADAGLDDTRVVFIAGTAARKTLQGRAVSSGGPTFIWSDRDTICNRPGYCTSAMTTGLMLAGDFSRAVLGIWGPGIQVEANPFEPTLFPKGIVQMRVTVSCDVSVPQVAAFCKTTSVT